MKHTVIGILAHVDAGKTTLSEGLLYASGVIDKTGRVDDGDAFLDTYEIEKQRGITVFSKQAILPVSNERSIVLLDTPGHADFVSETERVLSVLDYAILVISATDGVQGHTKTLWRLLRNHQIPTIIFVNKMDRPDTDKGDILYKLKNELSDDITDMTSYKSLRGVSTDKSDIDKDDKFLEDIATLDENVMDKYLETLEVDISDVRDLIINKKCYPCFFGSALRLIGVDDFFKGICELISDSGAYGAISKTDKDKKSTTYGARVYKISRDDKGERLTFIRVVSGSLHTRDEIYKKDRAGDDKSYGKIHQIRIYSGDKYKTVDELECGMIGAITGISDTYPGQGLGIEKDGDKPEIIPVLNYELKLPDGVDATDFLPKMRELEEEEPELLVVWVAETKQIKVRVMGEIQIEILKNIIKDRYDTDIEFSEAGIVYKETVGVSAIGIGHFEPLKHYAEVHLLIEPGVAGSGLVVKSNVSEDKLDKNRQSLILTHLLKRQHPGVLTGAPVTDMTVTLIAGKDHIKHTEGGDFRQATYRALRQGLMQAECILLEPYYDFVLKVPEDKVGKAMTDIDKMRGIFIPNGSDKSGMATITGYAPVVTMRGYPKEVTAYTKGEGSISLSFCGYLPCHNQDDVISDTGYDPDTDEDNPTGSVFCAHGSGYYVPWYEVKKYAHADSGYVIEDRDEIGENDKPEFDMMREMDLALGVDEIDDILSKAGSANVKKGRISHKGISAKRVIKAADKLTGPHKTGKKVKKKGKYLLIDGYNVIYAWESLSAMARDDMAQARGRLLDILCNYQGFKGGEVIAVFDAYRLTNHPTEVFDYNNIHVVYTKTAETADQYIERFSHEKASEYDVTVVTSDGLEQVIIRGVGAHLMSARDFKAELEYTDERIREVSES